MEILFPDPFLKYQNLAYFYFQLGENQYLRNFPFRAHLREKYFQKVFFCKIDFQIDLQKIIRD